MDFKTRVYWETLGWDSTNWEAGAASSSSLDWTELSPEERAAASELGYNQERWDEEDDSDQGSNFWSESRNLAGAVIAIFALIFTVSVKPIHEHVNFYYYYQKRTLTDV